MLISEYEMVVPKSKAIAGSDHTLSSFNTTDNVTGAGLFNLGNTCFMNAVLQCFTHTTSLVQWFRSRDLGLSHICGTKGFCLLCALCKHIDVALTSSGRAVQPSAFVNNLKDISSDFEVGQQEDAQEFFQCFLDRLEECCLESGSLNKYVSHHDNVVEHIFCGSLMSRLSCSNCGHYSDTPERLIGFSLEINNVDTLTSALESFTKVERIEDSEEWFTCKSCTQKGAANKKLMLEKLPTTAVMHLKRFKTDGYRVKKISKHVDFPLELDLQPYYIGSCTDNEDSKYHLYGVVVHKGYSSNSGHYYSYVRYSPGVWYKFNDSKVTRVHETSVLCDNGYMMFYARHGTPWISDLIQVPRSFDLKPSPNSVLDNKVSVRMSYGSPLGVKVFDSRDPHEKRHCIYPFVTNHKVEGDQIKSSAGRYSVIKNVNLKQVRPSKHSYKFIYNGRQVPTLFDKKSNNEMLPQYKVPQYKVPDCTEMSEAVRLVKNHFPMLRNGKVIAVPMESPSGSFNEKMKMTTSFPCLLPWEVAILNKNTITKMSCLLNECVCRCHIGLDILEKNCNC